MQFIRVSFQSYKKAMKLACVFLLICVLVPSLTISDKTAFISEKLQVSEKQEQMTESDGEICAPGCRSGWPGDDYCDCACLNEACGFDFGDCENKTHWCDAPEGEPAYCAPGCYNGWEGDNYCDCTCLNEACNLDGLDCIGKTINQCGMFVQIPMAKNLSNLQENYCSPGCTELDIGDGRCDCACMNSECAFDAGDCDDTTYCGGEELCHPGCQDYKISNGYCNCECLRPECDNDGLDCYPHNRDLEYCGVDLDPPNVELCAPGCLPAMLENDWCDYTCAYEECGDELALCEDTWWLNYTREHQDQFCSPGCGTWSIDNGWCDCGCLRPECQYDGMDCVDVTFQTCLVSIDILAEREKFELLSNGFPNGTVIE